MSKIVTLALLAALAGTSVTAEPEAELRVAGLSAAEIADADAFTVRISATATPVVISDDEDGVIVEEILSVYVIGKGITLTN